MERSPEFKTGLPFEYRPKATPDRSRVVAAVGKVATASTVQGPTAQAAPQQDQVQDLYAEYGPALEADAARAHQPGPDLQWDEPERQQSRDR